MTHAGHAPQIAYLSAQASLSPLAVVALRVAVVLTQWSMRHRTRLHLARLDDHLLHDIGLDRSTVRKEVDRKFWQM